MAAGSKARYKHHDMDETGVGQEKGQAVIEYWVVGALGDGGTSLRDEIEEGFAFSDFTSPNARTLPSKMLLMACFRLIIFMIETSATSR